MLALTLGFMFFYQTVFFLQQCPSSKVTISLAFVTQILFVPSFIQKCIHRFHTLRKNSACNYVTLVITVVLCCLYASVLLSGLRLRLSTVTCLQMCVTLQTSLSLARLPPALWILHLIPFSSELGLLLDPTTLE